MHYPDLSKSLQPATLGLVGLTPLLAVCTTLLSGLSMGLVFLIVLLLSAVTVSGIRRVIPQRFSLVYLLLIAAAWVCVIDLLMQAWFYALREQLGFYLYLLAMNTTVLIHLEAAPLRQNLRDSAPACLGAAVPGVVLLTVTGLARELAAQGGVLTDSRLLAHSDWLGGLQPVYFFTGSLHLFATSAGAFIVFGLLLALRSCVRPVRGPVRGPARWAGQRSHNTD